MVDQKTTPLRARMIEDLRIKGLGESSQKAHIRAVRYFAEFLGRSDAHRRNLPPRKDTANPSATQKAGRMMKRPSYARPLIRRSLRRSKGGFGSMPSTRCNRNQTKATKPENIPESLPKAYQPTLRTRHTRSNTNQNQGQTPALSP